MTKESYYEMCEMLGNEPVDSEIPVEMEDFPYVIQIAFEIYSVLTDNWDTMSGAYIGKDYNIVFRLFDLYHIYEGEALFMLNTLKQIDGIRKKLINSKLQKP